MTATILPFKKPDRPPVIPVVEPASETRHSTPGLDWIQDGLSRFEARRTDGEWVIL